MSSIARTFKSLALGGPSALFGSRAGANPCSNFASAYEMTPNLIKIESEAFGRNQMIPRRYTVDGENLSPPLNWSGVPPTTRALALIVEDPDTRGSRSFVHWLAYNILPDDNELPEGIPPGPILRSYCLLQAKNSFAKYGYV